MRFIRELFGFKRLQAMKNSKRSVPLGVTLVEVLVVLGVLSLLFAMLLPAVQYARESARRSTCKNNLRQLGIAIHAYSTSHGILPPGANGNGAYSLYAMILPNLEKTTLYNSINFGVNLYLDNGANFTVSQISISELICPSDRYFDQLSSCSYSGNAGTGSLIGGLNGVFLPGGIIPIADNSITDGTSNTIMLSEVLIGANYFSDHLETRLIFKTPIGYVTKEDYPKFIMECLSMSASDIQGLANSQRGQQWIVGELGETLYNHVLIPGSNTCSDNGLTQEGAWTASSRHSGGIHSLFADSHVSFLRNGMQKAVWASLGSRSGNEIIDGTTDY